MSDFRELLIPGRIIRPRNPWGGGHYWLNASIVESWGKTLLVSRVGRIPAMLACHELDGDFHPKKTVLLFGCSASDVMAEDPRAVYDPESDSVRIWYCGIHQGKRYPACSIFTARMDQGYRITEKKCERYDAPTAFESIRQSYSGIIQQKNWVPFRQDGRWLCIYGHEPLTILEKFDGGMRLHHQSDPVGWGFGAIRGGCPPVWHDGRWWHFFHSSVEMFRDSGDIGKVYYVGCYTFDRKFEILGMTREPLMAGDKANCSAPWGPVCRISAVFPCGAIVRGDNWIISYGFLDQEVRIAQIPISEVEGRLFPLTNALPS